MSASNKEIVEKINQAFADNDPEAFLAHCVDEVRWTMVGKPPIEGKEAVRQFMGSCGPAAPPQFDVKRLFGEGDHIMCDGTMKMTMETGEPYHGAYCDVYRFKDGKVVELTTYMVDLPAAGS